MSQPPLALAHVRAECYQVFGLRRDSLSDLLDAVLTSDRVTSLVQLSQSPLFRRRWSSLFDALADGRIDRVELQRVLGRWSPPLLPQQRLLWAIDGSSWPRPAAVTSPQRTSVRVVQAGTPQSRITGGWEYQWLMAIPEPQGSWVLPLAVGRRHPQAGTPTELAVRQVRQALRAQPAGSARPVVVLDSHYDVPYLVQTALPVDWLARLAKNRKLYRAPRPSTGTGRPAIHGPIFRLADPTTQGGPAAEQRWHDPTHGRVILRRWDGLHTQAAPQVVLTVVQIMVDRLPRRGRPPAPLWLVWHGPRCPDDLRQVWQWYQRRFAIEHGFRFLKQCLGWTVPRLRHPEQADRWSWLLVLVLWQLWLARVAVADARLPWERAVPPDQGSPGRVRRAMGAILARLGTRAPPPQPRGNAPGRQLGQRPRPHRRHPIHRRHPKPAR